MRDSEKRRNSISINSMDESTVEYEYRHESKQATRTTTARTSTAITTTAITTTTTRTTAITIIATISSTCLPEEQCNRWLDSALPWCYHTYET